MHSDAPNINKGSKQLLLLCRQRWHHGRLHPAVPAAEAHDDQRPAAEVPLQEAEPDPRADDPRHRPAAEENQPRAHHHQQEALPLPQETRVRKKAGRRFTAERLRLAKGELSWLLSPGGRGRAQFLERVWDRNSRFAAMLSLSESAFSADSLTYFPHSSNICMRIKNPKPLAASTFARTLKNPKPLAAATRLDARKILRTHGRNRLALLLWLARS